MIRKASCEQIIEGAIEGILIAELESKKFCYANKAICDLFGYSMSEMLSLTVADIHPAEHVPEVVQIFEKQARGELALAVDVPCLKKDGTVFYADINTSKTTIDDLDCNVGFFADVTERKNARDEIDASERLLSSVFEAVPDLLVVIDGNFQIIYSNYKSHERIVQPDDQKAKTCYGRFKLLDSPCEDCSALPVFETGKIVERETTNPADGRTREIRAFPIKDRGGKVVYVVEYVRDITDKIQAQEDRLKLEQQIQQNQRLESLGVLAGGIAHDFNNLLVGVFGFLDMAREQSTETAVNSYLDRALNAMKRAQNLTQQLLTFAKGGSPNKKTDSLVTFIHDTTEFALSGSNVSSNFVIPQDLWICEYDTNQLSQVVENIVINAVQAMPLGGAIRGHSREHRSAGKRSSEPGFRQVRQDIL